MVEDEQPHAGDGSQQPGVARITVRNGEIREEPRHSCVENSDVFAARLVAERRVSKHEFLSMVVARTAQIDVVDERGRRAVLCCGVGFAGEQRGDALAIEDAEFDPRRVGWPRRRREPFALLNN
jgi:hypothetical protein